MSDVLDKMTHVAAGKMLEAVQDAQDACGEATPEEWAVIARDLRESSTLLLLLVDCQASQPR